MTDKEKLKKLVEISGKSQKEFAALIGISSATFANWCYRGKITPTAANLILRKFPEINPDWLAGRSDELKRRPLTPEDKQYRNYVFDDIVIENDTVAFVKNEGIANVMEISELGDRRYLRVVGCSLPPVIKAGDIISIREVEKGEKFEKGDIFFIINKENERCLKFINYEDDDYYYVSTPNTIPVVLPKQSVLKVYLVDSVTRILHKSKNAIELYEETDI